VPDPSHKIPTFLFNALAEAAAMLELDEQLYHIKKLNSNHHTQLLVEMSRSI
jgi:hypothetical protein